MRKANSSLYTPAIVGRGRSCHEPCHFGSSQVKKNPQLYLKPNAHERGILLFKVFVYIILRGFWYPYGLCLCKRTCLQHVKIWYAINSELLQHSLSQCSQKEGCKRGVGPQNVLHKNTLPNTLVELVRLMCVPKSTKQSTMSCSTLSRSSLHILKILNFLSAFK